MLGGINVTILLVADMGMFTGAAEGTYYAKALQNSTTVDPGLTPLVWIALDTSLNADAI